MDQAIITQLKIIRMIETKPNFAALGRRYDVDWRTVKKYYDGYEGKPIHRNKSSKLDKYRKSSTTRTFLWHHFSGTITLFNPIL